MPCSIERMPARMAFLMPSVAWACAMTSRPPALASATQARSSSRLKWACLGLSRGESTPPEVQTLITSAPARRSSRTLRRISSTPSTMPQGSPGWGVNRFTRCPLGIQPSVCPPVWPSTATAIRRRGPETRPSSTACLTPRSAPPASRTVVMPRSSVRSRLRAAAKNW